MKVEKHEISKSNAPLQQRLEGVANVGYEAKKSVIISVGALSWKD